MARAGKTHRLHRERRDDHDNPDRWLVSYADFMTLLFAFFVVMYAISSINEGKYRVLSNSLVAAFGKPGKEPGALAKPTEVNIQGLRQARREAAQRQARQQQAERMKSVASELLEVMAPLVQQGVVSVIESDRGITIEIKESLLFAPGQAQLDPRATRAMRAVANVIAPTEYPITIEGHTDNVPIATPQFPSNWELSAVRATTVLRLFADSGVAAARLTAIGYGDQRPIATNDDAAGRAKNRRVAIQIEATLPAASAAPPQ